MKRTGRSRNPFVFLAIVLFAESYWLVVTFCPNNQEWEIERLHRQMKVRLQRKDEEIRHLRNELRACEIGMRTQKLQVEEERKQKEGQLRRKEKKILKLEHIIQSQNRTIHNLTVSEGRKLKRVEEYNQMREEQIARKIKGLKGTLRTVQISCEIDIRSRVEREQRECEHQLSEKEAVIWDTKQKLQSMTNKCNECDQLWCVTGIVACASALLAIPLFVYYCVVCVLYFRTQQMQNRD